MTDQLDTAAIRAHMEALNGCHENVRAWSYYPIEMPLDAQGNGPAKIGEDAVTMTYEVWDRLLVSYASYSNLPDAVNDAITRNGAVAAMRAAILALCDEVDRLIEKRRMAGQHLYNGAKEARYRRAEIKGHQRRITALQAENERLRRMLDLRGVGPAERYWEGRWRDEAAETDRLREALNDARWLARERRWPLAQSVLDRAALAAGRESG